MFHLVWKLNIVLNIVFFGKPKPFKLIFGTSGVIILINTWAKQYCERKRKVETWIYFLYKRHKPWIVFKKFLLQNDEVHILFMFSRWKCSYETLYCLIEQFYVLILIPNFLSFHDVYIIEHLKGSNSALLIQHHRHIS